MPILFDLPTDIALAVLMAWLGDRKILASLDSASAHSVRCAYLGLIRNPVFVVSQMFNFGENNNIVTDMRYWISNRGIKVKAIKVTNSAMKQATLISYESLSTVSSLTLASVAKESTDLESFRILLRLLPSLTSLDMGKLYVVNQDHLVVLSAMRNLHLRTLILDEKCTECESIVLLLHSFGSSLEVLNTQAQWIDAATLKLMGSTCSNMHELSFRFEHISPEVLAAALGTGNFPLLEKITIRNYDLVVNDDVVLALCASHPNLQFINVECSSNVTLLSIGVALSHCPHFRELSTTSFDFKTVFVAEDSRDSVELPHYKLCLRDFPVVVNLRVVFQSIVSAPYYNHRLQWFQSFATHRFANDEVDEIINAFGSDLHILQVRLEADVSHQTMERLFRECSSLRTLYLEGCETFTDELVMLLVDQCHHIVFLSLADAVNVTNMSMCCLLQRMGHQLASLYIDQCSQLTSYTLTAIVEYCTSLERLDMTGTGISAHAVVAHVIKPNHLQELDELTVGQETLESFRVFAEKAENGANMRWKRILRLG